MKVLFIEDDDQIADLVKQNLKDLGHNFVWCHDGESVVKVLENFGLEHFDFVLSDVQVPGYNILQMKDACDKRQIPLLVQSGNVRTYHEFQMQKALDKEELEEMMERTMGAI